MKKILILLSGMALFTISGCLTEEPPLTAFDAWEKSGADKLEVKKAVLECGLESLSSFPTEKEDFREKINRDASVDACLIREGFRDKFGVVNWCEKYKADNLPICQPGAVIPQRSVTKRLNSPYCQENKDQPECQP